MLQVCLRELSTQSHQDINEYTMQWNKTWNNLFGASLSFSLTHSRHKPVKICLELKEEVPCYEFLARGQAQAAV